MHMVLLLQPWITQDVQQIHMWKLVINHFYLLSEEHRPLTSPAGLQLKSDHSRGIDSWVSQEKKWQMERMQWLLRHN